MRLIWPLTVFVIDLGRRAKNASLTSTNVINKYSIWLIPPSTGIFYGRQSLASTYSVSVRVL
jgi:hypothetical protein